MALVGNRYIQAGDPGATGAGYQWLNSSSGNLYERNTADTGWTFIGNVNQASYALLPKSGGDMTGAITGAHGLAPYTDADFSGNLRVGGLDVATQTWATAQIAALQTTINSRVSEAISSASSSITTKNNIAYASGIYYDTPGNLSSTGYTIALPQYKDLTTASVGDILDYGAALTSFDVHDNVVSATNRYISVVETAAGSRIFKINYSGWPNAGLSGNWGIAWWILAAR